MTSCPETCKDAVEYAEKMEIYQPIKQIEDQSPPIDLSATAGDNRFLLRRTYMPSSSAFTDKFCDSKAPWTTMLGSMVTRDD